MIERTSVPEIKMFTIDIDGFLLRGVTWLKFTHKLFTLAGKPELADWAVGQHGEIYGTFHEVTETLKEDFIRGSITRDEYQQKYNEEYLLMVNQLIKLWNKSEQKLTKRFIDEVTEAVIEEDILQNGTKELIDFLQQLHRITNIPFYILSGTFSPLADKLAKRLDFDGAEANSLFVFGQEDVEYAAKGKIWQVRPYSEVHDDEELTGLIYNPSLDSKKVNGLYRLENSVPKPPGTMLDSQEIVSLVDGDGSDEQLPYHSRVFALNPKNPNIITNRLVEISTSHIELMKQVIDLLVSTHPEKEELNSELQKLLPKRTKH